MVLVLMRCLENDKYRKNYGLCCCDQGVLRLGIWKQNNEIFNGQGGYEP